MARSRDEHKTLRVQRLAIVHASTESLDGYGLLVGTDVTSPGLPIPFYDGHVVEGQSLPFRCGNEVVLRSARIDRRDAEVIWLERHLRMTQLFVGLGDAAFVLVMGKPTHERGSSVPDLDSVTAFRVPAGHGVLLHAGTWHDFPMAIEEPVTVLTVTSAEIVAALATAKEAIEIDAGDVFKIHVGRRLRTRFVVDLP